MEDLISRQDDFEKKIHAMFDHIWDCEIDHPVFQDTVGDLMDAVIQCHKGLPSAQPETSRIENALHGKSAEEQYDFIWWLLQSYAMNFTDSRQAAIEWLKGDGNDQQ